MHEAETELMDGLDGAWVDEMADVLDPHANRTVEAKMLARA